MNRTYESGITAWGAAACSLSRWVLDTVLPPQCMACRAPAGAQGALCPACWTQVEFIAAPLCGRTGIPFAYDPGEGIASAEALLTPPRYARARAVACYGDVVARLVHGLKYYDRLETAPSLGRWMARSGAELLRESDVVVPVPLHVWRCLWRRYNQSALLARVVARAGGVPLSIGALKRTRRTRSQVGLSGEQRRANVARAFRVDAARAGEIAGRRVLLIDDVLTSGATANACADALLRAGAGAVDVLVFARVVKPGALVL